MRVTSRAMSSRACMVQLKHASHRVKVQFITFTCADGQFFGRYSCSSGSSYSSWQLAAVAAAMTAVEQTLKSAAATISFRISLNGADALMTSVSGGYSCINVYTRGRDLGSAADYWRQQSAAAAAAAAATAAAAAAGTAAAAAGAAAAAAADAAAAASAAAAARLLLSRLSHSLRSAEL